ncbi:MAG: oligosaccharide flippase family protein, partial [Methylococcales bacterium]
MIILYSGEVISKILGIVVFGYLGRTLLEARYGDLEFSLAWLFLFNLVIDAGLAPYGAREAAKEPQRTAQLVGQIALVRAGLVIISVILLVAISQTVQMEAIARTLVLCQGLVLLPAPLIINWVFQSRDQMQVVAACSLLRQIIFSVGVIAFVQGPSDVLLVPLADAIGLSIAVLIQIFLYIKGGETRVSSKHLFFGARRVVAESLPLTGSSVVWARRLFFPLLALGLFGTSAETGIFGAGHRLVIAAHQFVWLYFFNLLPSLSRLAVSESLDGFHQLIGNSMRFVGWVAIFGAGLGTVLAPVLL